jgi:hypothetical protein
MDELKPKLSRYIFGLAALAFFLPFINFSCAEMKVAEVKGIDMVFGSSIEANGELDFSQMAENMESGEDPSLGFSNSGTSGEHKVEPSFLAILALGCCILGLLMSFTEADRVRLMRIGLAVIAAGSLIVLRFMIESEIEGQAMGIVQVDTAVGFWIVLALLAGAVWLNYSNESNNTREPFVRARIEPRVIGNQPPKSDVPHV